MSSVAPSSPSSVPRRPVPMLVLCPHCKKQFRINDEQSGKLLLCPHCSGRSTVPFNSSVGQNAANNLNQPSSALESKPSNQPVSGSSPPVSKPGNPPVSDQNPPVCKPGNPPVSGQSPPVSKPGNPPSASDSHPPVSKPSSESAKKTPFEEGLRCGCFGILVLLLIVGIIVHVGLWTEGYNWSGWWPSNLTFREQPKAAPWLINEIIATGDRIKKIEKRRASVHALRDKCTKELVAMKAQNSANNPIIIDEIAALLKAEEGYELAILADGRPSLVSGIFGSCFGSW